MDYSSLKLIHILSSTILFGTGIGTAFFMLQAYRSKNIDAITIVSKYVILADYIFTTPAVIIQPLTGYLLMLQLGHSFSEQWLKWTIVFYILIGSCWLPVVWLQIKLHAMALHAKNTNTELPRKFHDYFQSWFILGWPAFIMVIIIFYLMVFKSF